MSCLGFHRKIDEYVGIKSILRIFRGTKQKDKASEDSAKEVFIPPELISEILSWLPVKSILRFKCVCKTWLSITEDRDFIDKQMMCVPDYFCAVEEGNGHLIEDICQGLILEKTGPDSTYRLRNPSTKRVLDLPHHNERNAYRETSCYVSGTKTFKVVFPFANGELNGNVSCKILTVGVDEEWRRVDFPFACNLKRVDHYWYADFIGGGLRLWYIAPHEPEQRKRDIAILEVESEKVWRMTTPQRAGPYSNRSHVGLMTWARKLSFYQRSANEGNEILRVWVVEDYKKQKWAEEMIVVDLTPAKDLIRDYSPCSFYGSKIRMHRMDNNKYLSFDIVSKVVTHINSPEHSWRGRTNLMEFKGMKPCA